MQTKNAQETHVTLTSYFEIQQISKGRRSTCSCEISPI